MKTLAAATALVLAILAAPAAAQPEAGAATAKPVAVFALRASVVPRPEDVAVLQAGQSLTLGSSSGGMTIVEYGVRDGRITYTVTSGAISEATRKQIDRAVARMQERLSR